MINSIGTVKLLNRLRKMQRFSHFWGWNSNSFWFAQVLMSSRSAWRAAQSVTEVIASYICSIFSRRQTWQYTSFLPPPAYHWHSKQYGSQYGSLWSSKVKHFERRPFETLDFTVCVLAEHQPFYIYFKSVLLCIHHTWLSSTFQYWLCGMKSTIVFTFWPLCLDLMLGIDLVLKTSQLILYLNLF